MPSSWGGERRQVLEAIKGKRKAHGTQSTFCLLSFYDMPRPCADLLHTLFHLILTISYEVGTTHGPTLLASKLRLRELTSLDEFIHPSSWKNQFSPSLWDSRGRAVNDWVDDCKLLTLTIIPVIANCKTLCKWKAPFYLNSKLSMLNLL